MISAILTLLQAFITFYIWIIIIIVLIDMIKPGLNNPMLNAFRGLVYPPLRFIREKMPFVIIENIDLSPLILIVALEILKNIILR